MLLILGGLGVVLVIWLVVFNWAGGDDSGWTREDRNQLKGFVASELCSSFYEGCSPSERRATDCVVDRISHDYAIADWREIESAQGSYEDFAVTLDALILSSADECD